jgi:hypothetical protein
MGADKTHGAHHHFWMRRQHVEQIDLVAEAVAERGDGCRWRDPQPIAEHRLVLVGRRRHADLEDILGHRVGIGQPRFVDDAEDHERASIQLRK